MQMLILMLMVSELDNSNVSGFSTFASPVDINSNVDISGFSTFASPVDINSNVDISGFSTFASPVDINSNVHVSGVLTATTFEGTGKVIGIGSEGTAIGTGVSFIDFRSSTGTAFSCQPTVNGIATVTVTPGASIGLVIALGG